MEDNLKQQIKEVVLEVVKQYNKNSFFTDRKVTDTPTEAFSIVNRKFATLNGLVASRPVSSVAVLGQHYYATDTNIPMVFDGNKWRNGIGSIVAQNI